MGLLRVLSVWGFTDEGRPLGCKSTSSMPPAKTQDEGIVVMDKFGTKSRGDPNFSPVDKTGLFMKKGIVKELPWKNNATTKKLLQI